MEKASAINVLEKWEEFCREVSSSRLRLLRKAGEWYCHERTGAEDLWQLEARDGLFPEVQPMSDGDLEVDASSLDPWLRPDFGAVDGTLLTDEFGDKGAH